MARIENARGARLFELVGAYSELGWHRSGGDADQATAEWFARCLADVGLDAEIRSVPFVGEEVTSRLTVGGEPVEHLVLGQEFEGQVDTTDVAVVELDVASGGFPEVTDPAVADAMEAGRSALVIATAHPDGDLVAVNRKLGRPPSGMPTVLVSGREFERLDGAEVRLVLEVTRSPRSTANVVARTGVTERPILLTTPLNGWFAAAGERGTGVAITLEMIRALGHEIPLEIVATGGHELGCLGALDRVGSASSPRAVFHVGASVAVEEPTDRSQLISSRLALTSLPPEHSRALAMSFARGGLSLQTGIEDWFGEAVVWAELGCPIVSLTGAGRDFHTPSDLPERVTSAASLERVCASLVGALTALDRVVPGAS